MAEATLVNDNFKTLDYSAGTATAGEILQIDDGRVGVIVNTLATSGDKGALMLDGLFDVSSASATTFSAGDSIFWDKSASAAVAYADADDIYIGKATAAKTNGQVVVRVDLNVLTYVQIAALIAA